MKKIKSMSQVELAAYIQDSLQADNIYVVLSGFGMIYKDWSKRSLFPKASKWI